MEGALIRRRRRAGGSGGGGSSIPTVHNSSTESIATGVSTETFTLPGTPAQDDLVIVFRASDINLDATSIVTSGYTSHHSTSDFSPGSDVEYKIMGATPDTQVEISQNSLRQQAVAIYVIRGANTTTPIDADATPATGSTGMPNAPSLTTVTENTLRMIWGSLDDDPLTDGTAPAGWSNFQYQGLTGIGGELAAILVATKDAAAIGSDDPDAFGGSGNDQWRAGHFSIRAA